MLISFTPLALIVWSTTVFAGGVYVARTVKAFSKSST